MRTLWRFLLVWARRMVLGYAILLFVAGLGALAFHRHATSDPLAFERTIQWSTRYILVPATLVQDRGLPAEAVLPLVRVIDALFIASAGIGPPHDAHRYWQGRLLLPLAATYGKLGDRQRQLSRGRRSLAIFSDLAQQQPEKIDYRRRLARANDLLADDLVEAGNCESALPHYRASALIAEGLLRDEPHSGRWQRYQVKALAGIAGCLDALGRYDQTHELLLRAQAAARRVPPELAADAEWDRIVAAVERGLRRAQAP